jgi:acyl-coenzyme A synthetase/AMP-(fatty) acid ligase
VSFRSDPLPKSNTGKVLRRLVAEQEARQAAGASAA